MNERTKFGDGTDYAEMTFVTQDYETVRETADKIFLADGWDFIGDGKVAASCLAYRGDDMYFMIHADSDFYFGSRYMLIYAQGARLNAGLEMWLWSTIHEKFGGAPRFQTAIRFN